MKKSLLLIFAYFVCLQGFSFAEESVAVVDLQQIVSNSSQVKNHTDQVFSDGNLTKTTFSNEFVF